MSIFTTPYSAYDSLRPNERAGTKKYCKKILSYIDPFDNCATNHIHIKIRDILHINYLHAYVDTLE